MVVKFIILILTFKINFISNFPIENLSINNNKSNNNESREVNINNDTDSSQTDVNFELIHENDENTKVIKSKYGTTKAVLI